MIASIIFSIAVFSFIFGAYFYLDYRMERRQWNTKTKKEFKIQKDRKSFIVVLGDKFDESDYGKQFEKKLRKINLQLTPSEFYSMLIVGFIGLFFVLNRMFNIGGPMSLVFSLGAIIAINQLLFILRRNKLEEKLNDQLSEICSILSSATKSGMTITQGIQLVANQINEPARSEFQRISNELSLGVEFEQVLTKFQERTKGRDFKLFIVTLLTQKRAGGNIHDTLEEMAETLDDRKMQKQEIKTLTSEQRMVAYIVPVIPIFLVLFLNTVMDGYIDQLFSFFGIILLVIFGAGTALSFYLVRKVTNIRV